MVPSDEALRRAVQGSDAEETQRGRGRKAARAGACQYPMLERCWPGKEPLGRGEGRGEAGEGHNRGIPEYASRREGIGALMVGCPAARRAGAVVMGVG